ncbi:PepSY domain-containing protein [Pedobacter sp. MC2016-14]|uniref:PepSY-associated TM helix domain-containing protein n=1 Tax=Pedobacter sp. MC2016-14 TaxID=2897327 RepID=UPI001E43EA3A|nr:PepSY-associated TM helix domain-containing protein [Pedobacter sp. MC2016-14]MCD0489160.1 PepSY domain-containing protein [Pedobacter sp. MC2016-14]
MAKAKKSTFRRISNWLHLWLGLFSGIVVFVVCLTAAVWTFGDDYEYWFMPGQRIAQNDGKILPPSLLIKKCRLAINATESDSLAILYSLEYRGPKQSCILSYTDRPRGDFKRAYVDPYSGKILYYFTKEDAVFKFNQFLRSGHRFFWLPRPFGSYFVGTCCLLFLVTLITGFIWWYPTKWNKSTRNKSFKIKWGAKWKRVNIDLHNVLGFYTLIFTIILTVTGVAFTFSWFSDGYHWLLTGGAAKATHASKGVSNTNIVISKYQQPDDQIWRRFKHEEEFSIKYPQDPKDVYVVYLHPSGHNELTTWHSYDQNTLNLVGGSSKQKPLSIGDKIHGANYEIHTGAIGGLITKIIAALASLVGASLPVTGFIIWINRKF